MKIFIDFIRSESDELRLPLLLMAVFAGIVNGLAVAVAIRTVSMLEPGNLNFPQFVQFAACLVAFWFSKEHVLNRTTKIVEKIILKIRVRILEKLRQTDLLVFEGMDRGKIFSTLSTDAITISVASDAIINAGSSVVMLLFIAGYIAVLSMPALAISGILMVLTVLIYLQKSRHVKEQLASASALENTFYDNLNGLLSAFKDFKLNRAKAEDFQQRELKGVVTETSELRLKAGKTMNVAVLIGQTFLFVTVAGLLFLLPNLKPEDIRYVGLLVPVILFAAGPIGDIVAAVPAVAKAQASINNLRTLEQVIDSSSNELESHAQKAPIRDRSFESLVCEEVAFEYPANGTRPFSIEPFNFALKKGEIVFLVGGNGSGKSTVLKLITGLYQTSGGRILFNGQPVDANNLADYRHLFATIFTDFFLFKRLLGMRDIDQDRIDQLLRKFELTGKTNIIDGEVTNRSLSTGQRKRLALILATLEDKAVYIFDEWAADQDPVFRRYFYEEILPELKAQGKTILAVTHDDHYFHLADRVLMMEYGKMQPFSGGADFLGHPQDARPS
jgi:putative ATP-binding cassette transporter